MTNLDGVASNRFATDMAIAMAACKDGHPTDEQTSLVALTGAKWWRSELLASRPWRGALAFGDLHVEMADELAALKIGHATTNFAGCSFPEDQVINRARQAGDAKLSVLCDAVGCKTDDLDRAAERIHLPVRAVRYLLAVALAERVVHELLRGNIPSIMALSIARVQRWCNAVLCCALVAEDTDSTDDGPDAAGRPQRCWLLRHETVGRGDASDVIATAAAGELSPAPNTFDGIYLALDIVEAECMSNVAWSTCGEPMPRQLAARRRIEMSAQQTGLGADDSFEGVRVHPMARIMAHHALSMARVWVARLARRRERAAEEGEEGEEEGDAPLDLFD